MVFKCFTKTWQAVSFDRITELFHISNSWVPCSNVHIQLWSLRKDFHWYLQFCFISPCKTFPWISKNWFFFKILLFDWSFFFFFFGGNFKIIKHQTEKCDLVQEMAYYLTYLCISRFFVCLEWFEMRCGCLWNRWPSLFKPFFSIILQKNLMS